MSSLALVTAVTAATAALRPPTQTDASIHGRSRGASAALVSHPGHSAALVASQPD